ncbi:TonB-dependent receptor [Curvibacter sp. CHRR-16]|uniref:TonB-dependent receptor n=1 Tax=Curvibacter sp. CHRR-16 TaxID=2835872 RepID=UPI001BDA61FE|nr:TonB-dependent receptor [Curvibacter sp. CHRR-16]MBT0571330.1 TonB-dependent receptor [Curvibacter sp. CHRR-16]
MKCCSLLDIRRGCACMLVAAGVAGPCWAQTSAGASSASPHIDSTKAYAIPAGPLLQVLMRFAAEADINLSFDAELLANKQSTGLQGRYKTYEGLSTLLHGHGLRAQSTQHGFTVVKDQDTRRTSQETVGELPTVTVVDTAIGSTNALSREMLQSLPSLNGDFTSQLKINPNIQFAETQLSSQTGGEISPAEISIHGSKPYQNEILLDGFSIANDIDPGSKGVTSTQDPEFIPAGSQALAVDADLLCNVTVKDSNVSAEYSRFTGGVVEAELCKARKAFGGKVSVGYSGSNWTHLIIDPAQEAEFNNSSSADNQPQFRKWTYKASVETRPSADWGLAISTVRRTSDIPLIQYTATGQTNTQTRVNDTLAIKADWSPQGSRDSADLTMVYAPSEGRYFIKNAKDSDYTLVGGGLALSARLVRGLEAQTLTQQLSFTQTQQSRQSDTDYYTPWRWSTAKNWGDRSLSSNAVTTTSIEGSFGNVEQQLQTWNYKIKSQLDSWDWGKAQHRMSTGLDLKQQNAKYQRVNDFTQYYGNPTQITAWTSSLTQAGCALDIHGCSTSPTLTSGSLGQYFRNRYVYKAGTLDVDAQSFGAFVEDQIRWNDWTWTLGARVDYDSLVDDTNVAPRSKMDWDATEDLRLTAGLNRYYGRSLMAYALQERVRSLRYTQTRNSGSLTWNTATQNRPANRLQDIDSPYDDELFLGMQWNLQTWGTWEAGLTGREGKNQIVKKIYRNQTGCDANQCYVYTNSGGSTTVDFTLGWSSNEHWNWGPTETTAWASFNKSDVRSNYSTYADTYSATDDEIVQYNGQFMRYADMPADNYNRPWTLRLAAMTKVPRHDLTITNVLRIRAGYEQMTQTGTTTYNDTTVDVWSSTKLAEAVTLDTVLQWTPYVRKKQQLDVKLTIENILDRANMTTTTSSYATYERGRTFMLEVGYVF